MLPKSAFCHLIHIQTSIGQSYFNRTEAVIIMVNESHIDTGSKLAQYHLTPVQIFMKNHAGIKPKGVHVYERSEKCQPWTSWHIKRNSNNISIGFPLGIPAGFTTLPQPDCERGKALVNYWHCESATWHDVSRHCESANPYNML